MISPVSLNSSNVRFGDMIDLSAPGKYAAVSAESDFKDSFNLSSEAEDDKKNKVAKTAGQIAAGVVAFAAASYGLFKWKGAKWNVSDAKGFTATLKKYLVTPGKYIDDGFKKIGKWFSKGSKKAEAEAPKAETPAPKADKPVETPAAETPAPKAADKPAEAPAPKPDTEPPAQNG